MDGVSQPRVVGKEVDKPPVLTQWGCEASDGGGEDYNEMFQFVILCNNSVEYKI